MNTPIKPEKPKASHLEDTLYPACKPRGLSEWVISRVIRTLNGVARIITLPKNRVTISPGPPSASPEGFNRWDQRRLDEGSPCRIDSVILPPKPLNPTTLNPKPNPPKKPLKTETHPKKHLNPLPPKFSPPPPTFGEPLWHLILSDGQAPRAHPPRTSWKSPFASKEN